MAPDMLRLFTMPLALLAFLLAIVLIILSLAKLFTKGRWTVGIAALLLLLLAGLFAGIHFFRPTMSRLDDTVSIEKSSSALAEDAGPSIWLPGIEDQFKADVYPSKRSAIRALGLRISEPVREVLQSDASPSTIIVFKGTHDDDLIAEFGQAAVSGFPESQWIAAPETAAVQDGDVGIRLDFIDVDKHPAPWQGQPASQVTSGTVQATVMVANKQATAKAKFIEKPWVEDFSGFLNAHPDARFILARSTESCATEAEANRQAVQNACGQLTAILGETSGRKSSAFASHVKSAELLEGGFIADRFVQSFEGAAGKIWRQALLVDTSPDKLARLADRKAAKARAAKRSLAGMFLSAFGLLVLITVVYAFLNAATKGYYVWSLRIAGIVLALIGVVSIVIFLV